MKSFGAFIAGVAVGVIVGGIGLVKIATKNETIKDAINYEIKRRTKKIILEYVSESLNEDTTRKRPYYGSYYERSFQEPSARR